MKLKIFYLFFNIKKSNLFDELILKMTSILNQYFHNDGSLPLFNGSNNIYTKIIYNSLNKDTYLVKRDFIILIMVLLFMVIKIKNFFLM